MVVAKFGADSCRDYIHIVKDLAIKCVCSYN